MSLVCVAWLTASEARVLIIRVGKWVLVRVVAVAQTDIGPLWKYEVIGLLVVGYISEWLVRIIFHGENIIHLTVQIFALEKELGLEETGGWQVGSSLSRVVRVPRNRCWYRNLRVKKIGWGQDGNKIWGRVLSWACDMQAQVRIWLRCSGRGNTILIFVK